jgi:hypothetical protein
MKLLNKSREGEDAVEARRRHRYDGDGRRAAKNNSSTFFK